MAKIEMKVPSPGESITEVQIAQWLKKDGDYVEKDEEICEIDSDKATLTLNAEESGQLKILVKAGETIKVGTTVCSIDTDAAPAAQSADKKEEKREATKQTAPVAQKAPAEAANGKAAAPVKENQKDY